VWGGGCEVGIIEASKNSKRSVVWEGAVKELVGYVVVNGGGTSIEKEGGCG
jgi:hypothetical protein